MESRRKRNNVKCLTLKGAHAYLKWTVVVIKSLECLDSIEYIRRLKVLFLNVSIYKYIRNDIFCSNLNGMRKSLYQLNHVQGSAQFLPNSVPGVKKFEVILWVLPSPGVSLWDAWLQHEPWWVGDVRLESCSYLPKNFVFILQSTDHQKKHQLSIS